MSEIDKDRHISDGYDEEWDYEWFYEDEDWDKGGWDKDSRITEDSEEDQT